MRGKGPSVSQSQFRPCSGVKTLRKCKNCLETDNFVLIDVDSDGSNNVIIIDVPEGIKRKLRCSSALGKKNKFHSETVICLDDDDSAENNQPATGLDGEFNNGTSSGVKFNPSTSYSRRTVHAMGGQFHFEQENISPVKLSKGKRTYSGKTFSNRYGLMDSDSDSSDNDAPDCEVMEDFSGKFREQWEKASTKRKTDVQSARSDMREHGETSKSSAKPHPDVGAENITNTYPEVPVSSNSTKASCEKDDHFPSMATVNNLGSASCDPKMPPFDGTDLNLSEKADVADILASSESLSKDPSDKIAEHIKGKISEDGGSIFSKSGENDRASSSPSSSENIRPDNCPPKDGGRQAGQVFYFEPSVRPSNDNVEAFFKQAFSETSSLHKPGISSGNNFCHEKDDLIFKEPFLCSTEIDEIHLKQGNSLEEKEACVDLVSNNLEAERNDLLHAPDGEAAPVESSIINEREKLKETDEYKRAQEEEWISRQKTLQAQAEEAQQLRRLRKRQRAESMRLIDMERRQKKRVEEIRETQKKVEENMNLKELHRTEVRKELKKLETTCHDMASLLRGLGIQVGGGLHPQSHEVRAAYKRALFSFHPDRASALDMRQQVEAEEKFKLISRMKEKFLPAL